MKQKKLQLNISGLVLGFALLFFSFSAPMVSAEEVSADDIIKLVNQERKQAGLSELVRNDALDKAAELKAQDMIGNNYFAHTSPSGVDPWHWFEQAEYQYKYAGENLAMDFTSASSVHRAWMKSPAHKENIVSTKYKEIGVAILSGVLENRETKVAVQLFGTQLGSETALTKAISNNSEGGVSIKEASAYPWKETREDELLVYAKVEGSPQKVELVAGEKHFELLKHRENVYMNLLIASEIDPNNQSLAIKASIDEKQAVFYELSKENISSFAKQEEESQQQPSPLAALSNRSESFSFPSVARENIFLAAGLLLFLLMIFNVWILEKEEEKLLAASSEAS